MGDKVQVSLGDNATINGDFLVANSIKLDFVHFLVKKMGLDSDNRYNIGDKTKITEEQLCQAHRQRLYNFYQYLLLRSRFQLSRMHWA
jgi:hypothetical protein